MLAYITVHVRRCLFFISIKKLDYTGKNMLHEGIGQIKLSFCLVGWYHFLVLYVHLPVVIVLCYCYPNLRVAIHSLIRIIRYIWCWLLLCIWWSLSSHGENLLSFIIIICWINTCMGCCCSVIVGLYTRFSLGCDGIIISHRPSWWFRTPYITTSLSFIVYIFCFFCIKLQPSSHNFPSDNR